MLRVCRIMATVKDDDPLWRMVTDQRVPGAGRNTMRGLVARRDISKDEVITDFHVENVYSEDKVARGDKDQFFVVQISTDKYARLSKIDGRSDLKSAYDNKVGNLCNHRAKSAANAKMSVHAASGTISLRAKKFIQRGQPIFYDYGNEEWTTQFRDTKRAHRSKFPNLKQGVLPPRKRRKK